MKRLLLAAIWLYRRLVSPYKGFSCAWRVATGGESCSAYGRRVVERHGAVAGMALLRRRMRDCGAVHERSRPLSMPSLHRQRGECDVCDVCNPLDLVSCDCGNPAKWRKSSLPSAPKKRRRATSAPAPSPRP